MTYPTKLIAVLVGEMNGDQPAVVPQGSRQPNVTLYGSGFIAGDLLSFELLDMNSNSQIMEVRSGDSRVRGSGAFMSEVRLNQALTLDPGAYTVRVSSLSGISAAAPVVIGAESSP